MKIITAKRLITIFLMIIPFSGIAQWNYINQGNTCNYNIIKFISESEGWVMGGTCCIQKTTDGGATWIQVECNGTTNIQDFQFINDSVAYCTGWYFTGSIYSEVLKYDYTNESWNVIYNTDLTAIQALHFLDPLTGFIVSGIGIQKTIDGGISWSTVWDASFAGFNSAYLEDIIFVNDSIGFSCGKMKPNIFSQRGIVKSTDKGENWFVCYLDPDIGSGSILLLHQVKDNPDIIYGSSSSEDILKTIDCGITWETINSGIQYEYKPLYFINADTGYAAATFLGFFPGYEKLTMEIWRTNDGALTWNLQFVDSAYWQATNSIYFINDTIGFVAGWQTMLKTENGGIATGIQLNERTHDIEVKVYPNPTNQYVNVEISNTDSKKIILEVTNLSGKILHRIEYSNNEPYIQKIDLSEHSRGIYLLNIRTKKILKVAKLVIY
ncbi:MAG: T9SS type A sorting domain-containing protein [Bacteroidetes bacterium]|nr:T9SS type A sorting domain-containing protein [Bacteroidota bacterium]